MTFVDKEGEKHHFQVAEGDNLLDIAQANDLEMEGQFNFSSHSRKSFALFAVSKHLVADTSTVQAPVEDHVLAQLAM